MVNIRRSEPIRKPPRPSTSPVPPAVAIRHAARHQAHRYARLEGLLDHPNLRRRRPASATLNRVDDFYASDLISTASGQFVDYPSVGPLAVRLQRTRLFLSPGADDLNVVQSRHAECY